MILVDFSPIVIANFTSQMKGVSTPSLELIRHSVINTIRSHVVKHKRKFGKTVIAIDSKSWRKKVFQYYKAHRDKNRAESDIDWQSIFSHMKTIEEELTQYYPGIVLRIDGAEADDIIGVLAQYCHNQEPILVLSPDGDMRQLLDLPGVEQYSTILKKYLNGPGREVLITKIIKGDAKDGVPNVRSPDNTFVDKIRQKPISGKFLDLALKSDNLDLLVESEFGSDALRNLHRNKMLIDFSQIPTELRETIINTYIERSNSVSRMRGMKFMNYLVENDMALLAQSIQDF